MKRSISLFAIVLCFFMLIPTTAAAASPSFTDTGGHWAEQTIEQFFEEGIISGFPDGSFRPDQIVTRAELARIVTRAFDLTEEYAFEFSDVDPGAWYYDYLRFASRFIPNHQHGEGNFAGDRPAFRIDIIETLVLIYLHQTDLAIDMPTYEYLEAFVRSTFHDADYHYGDISFPNVRRLFRITWLSHFLGIYEGCPEGYFRPAWGLTRARVITIIDQMR